MSERAGVEIDYCPKCRGVWLDRGELDKIIAKAVAEEGGHAPSAPGAFAPGAAPPPSRPMPPMAPPPPPAHSGHPGHATPPGAAPGYQPYPPGYNPNADSKYGYSYQQPRKKSVWKELFDF